MSCRSTTVKLKARILVRSLRVVDLLPVYRYIPPILRVRVYAPRYCTSTPGSWYCTTRWTGPCSNTGLGGVEKIVDWSNAHLYYRSIMLILVLHCKMSDYRYATFYAFQSLYAIMLIANWTSFTYMDMYLKTWLQTKSYHTLSWKQYKNTMIKVITGN